MDLMPVADIYDSETRGRVMSRIRKRDTVPELRVRRKLHRLGFRFRLHRRDLPGVPDIVLPKHQVIVFVHGCFWHQHDCPLGKLPKSNRSYWVPKLRRNTVRDAEHRRHLEALGWRVVVVWECQTADDDRLEHLLSEIAGDGPNPLSNTPILRKRA